MKIHTIMTHSPYKNFFLELGGAMISSIVGFWVSGLLYDFYSMRGLLLDSGGCKNNIFVAAFIGSPVASVLGLIIIDTFIVRAFTLNVLAAVSLGCASFLGIVLGIGVALGFFLVLDLLPLGEVMLLIFLPSLIALGSYVGYKIGLRLASLGSPTRSPGSHLHHSQKD